jgi:hypothetical protein
MGGKQLFSNFAAEVQQAACADGLKFWRLHPAKKDITNF